MPGTAWSIALHCIEVSGDGLVSIQRDLRHYLAREESDDVI